MAHEGMVNETVLRWVIWNIIITPVLMGFIFTMFFMALFLPLMLGIFWLFGSMDMLGSDGVLIFMFLVVLGVGVIAWYKVLEQCFSQLEGVVLDQIERREKQDRKNMKAWKKFDKAWEKRELKRLYELREKENKSVED